MCRFAAYLGPEIFISSLVTEPIHSIIHQSYQAKERVEPLNGDGFGVGWYGPRFCDSPAVFKEVSPAWNNQNLRDIARVTMSSCIFAHVRAATVGGEVSRTNCHPFSWHNYLFMHNGTVFEFSKIQRSLRQGLSDEAYNQIKGYTDSEHIFALFIDQIKEVSNPTVEQLSGALEQVILQVELLKEEDGVSLPSTMNLALSDGKCLVATRYVSEGGEPNSLYYLSGDEFRCEDGRCIMHSGDKAVLIASEPLNSSSRWEKIPPNHMVLVNSEKKVTVQSFDFL